MAVSLKTDEYSIDRRPADSIGKGILFCGNCQHRSHYDDEWTLVETPDYIRYHCPHCHTNIMTRSSSSDTDTTDDCLRLEL